MISRAGSHFAQPTGPNQAFTDAQRCADVENRARAKKIAKRNQ